MSDLVDVTVKGWAGAPSPIPVAVNGKEMLLPVGVATAIPAEFVEALAASGCKFAVTAPVPIEEEPPAAAPPVAAVTAPPPVPSQPKPKRRTATKKATS